ncbi:hypothetical protein DD592_27085, partial [Enterobacter cloacae complex sp. 2DZ2F20B]
MCQILYQLVPIEKQEENNFEIKKKLAFYLYFYTYLYYKVEEFVWLKRQSQKLLVQIQKIF